MACKGSGVQIPSAPQKDMKKFFLETKELLFSQGVIALLAIIQIRIVAQSLGPDVYGRIGVYWGIIALCFRLLNSRNSDLILINLRSIKGNFLRSAILFEIVLGLVSFLLVYSLFLISINFGLLDFSKIPIYLLFFIISRIFLNVLEVFKGVYTHKGNLKFYSSIEGLSNLIRFTLVVSFIISNPQIDSFFYALSIHNILIGISISIFLVFKNRNNESGMSFFEYCKFSKKDFIKIRTDQSVGLIPAHLDVVVIGYFADFYSAGIYRIAKKLIEPINYLIVSFSPWMLNKITEEHKYNFRILTIKILIPMSLAIVFGYLFFGNQLIRLIAGSEYQDSYLPLIILLVGYLTYLLTFWTRHYLLLNELILKHTVGRVYNLLTFLILSPLLIRTYSFNGIAFSITAGMIVQKIYEVMIYIKNK